MNDIAIRVEGLSKKYRIGTSERPDTLRDWLVSLGRFVRSGAAGRTIWALQDVFLEIKKGDILGIIGVNGAGKSTLLKILAQITQPTKGRAIVDGRVGALLEVGTGFHPELTGRENIYLGGAVLGMSRREVSRKLDEIVEFSGVEEMLDTPVKRFSTGMTVRLGFAVAAHLDSEILLVDEVLAVGDIAFQQKCLGKIGEIVHGGRTVVFVSHNMAAIQNLCTSAILLDHGKVAHSGPVARVVEDYLLQSSSLSNHANFQEHPGRTPGSVPIVTGISINGLKTDLFAKQASRGFEINVEIDPPFNLHRPVVGLTVEDAHGRRICSFANHFSRVELPEINGRATVRCTLPDLPLLPGTYFLNVGVGLPHESLIDAIYRAISFKIDAGKETADVLMSASSHGPVRLPAEWAVIS